MPAKPHILIIGALPPPAIGPSVAIQRLINSTELNEAFSVSFLDISDRRSPDNIGQFDWLNIALGLKHACTCLIRLLFQRPAVVYLGISQGLWGYLRDLAFIVPALCLRRRVVIHLRGSEFRTFYEEMPVWLRWLTRWVLARTSRVIVLGSRLRKLFDGLVDPERIAVIPNGIDCQEFARRLAPPSENVHRKRLLYLSSLRKRKGLFLLLEALPRVFAKHPDLQVTIAGLWQSDLERAEAEALIARERLSDRLRFVGEVTGEAKRLLYQQHDLFVFTPIAPEGLPWVVLEAMSASLPVVTTDQGAIAEVVEHLSSGLIVQPTAESVAQGINYLLDNPAIAKAIGERARKRVEEHFSEQVYLSRLVALLGEVAGEQKRTECTGVAGKVTQIQMLNKQERSSN